MNDSKRLLFVDDETWQFDIIYSFFQKYNEVNKKAYKADFAASGADALIKVEKFDYDLIISDLSMPEISGLELSTKVRQRSDTPIILATGYADDLYDLFKEAVSNGVVAVEVKPLRLRHLARKIDSMFSSGIDAAISYHRAAMDLACEDDDNLGGRSILRKLSMIYEFKGQGDKAKNCIKNLERFDDWFSAYCSKKETY